jgi:tetratricopeptide (TPR) repeat protein
VNSNYAVILMDVHRYAEAEAQFHKTLERDPDFKPAHYKLSQLYLTTGRFPEAVSELQKFVSTPISVSPDSKGYVDLVSAQLRDKEWRTAVAGAYAASGDRNKAFEYLEKALADQDLELLLGVRWPVFDPMRSDPRFIDIMRRVGLPN